MGRLTKAQRQRLVPEGLAERLTVMDAETLLAVHDFIHGLMEQRFGTANRGEAGRAALTKERSDERN